MRKIILLAVAMVAMATSAYCGDVKVMRGISLIEEGENCKLIGEREAYTITPQTAKDVYGKAVTLKAMVADGWKIVSIKEMIGKHSTDHLFVFAKE